MYNLIKSKTRIRLLIKFFINIANSGYLNNLASEFGESTNSIRKELNNLSEAGYLISYVQNNKVIYRANQKHPLFNHLQKIIYSHVGLETILNKIIEKFGDIKKVFLLGDYARGIDSGNIEILIIGDNLELDYIEKIRIKLENKIDRKIHFMFSKSEPFNSGSLLVFEA